MEHIDQRVPQNMKDVIKEIGELSCVFWLYSYFSKSGWSVYRNFDEPGYDILLLNEQMTKKNGIRIEVKTRQRLVSSPSNKYMTSAYFTLSQMEREKADCLVACWLEKNWFFIVPAKSPALVKTPKTLSNRKTSYRLIVKVGKNGKPDAKSAKFWWDNEKPDADSAKFWWDQIIKWGAQHRNRHSRMRR